MQREKNQRSWLCWLLPAAAILIIILTVQFLYSRAQEDIREIAPVEGVLDITTEDLSQGIVNIRNNWDFYPNKLYTSEDFAVDEAGPYQEETDDEPKYGTYRLVIKAQPEQ